jgi:hypothetical protein
LVIFALGFAFDMALRERVSRKRHRRLGERHGLSFLTTVPFRSRRAKKDLHAERA